MEEKNNTKYMFLFAIIGLLAARTAGWWTIPIYDDAFITYRYASNLASGLGFVYNAGENVLGVTTPLFALLLSLFKFAGLELTSVAVFLNIIIDAVTLWLMFRFFEKEEKQKNFLILSFFFSISPIMTRVSVGGMEMSFFLLINILSVFLFFSNKKYLAVTTATIGYFVRPESALLVVVMVIWEIFKGLSYNKAIGKKSEIKKIKRNFEISGALKLAGVSLLVLALPLLLIYMVYGQILPQSITAKSGHHNPLLLILKEFLAADIIMMISLPFAVGAVIKNWRTNEIIRFVAVYSGLYFAAYLIFAPHIWSWYAHIVRFSVVFLASYSFGFMQRKKLNLKLNYSLLSGLFSAMIVCLWIVFTFYFGESTVKKNVYSPLAKWCKLNETQNKKILASDIGAIGYYSNAYVFDSEGLVTPQSKNYENFESMILKVQPDFLYLNLYKFNLLMMSKPPLSEMYIPVARFSKTPSSELYPNPEKVENIWYQDYILYKKLPGNKWISFNR